MMVSDDGSTGSEPQENPEDSHAAVLGIQDGADQAVVRAAYRQRIAGTDGDGDGPGAAGHSKQAITSAFQALSASSPGAASGSAAAAAEDYDDGVLSDSLSDADSDPNYSDAGDSADESDDETMYDRWPKRRARRRRRRQHDTASGLPWGAGSVGSSSVADCPLPGVDV